MLYLLTATLSRRLSHSLHFTGMESESLGMWSHNERIKICANNNHRTFKEIPQKTTFPSHQLAPVLRYYHWPQGGSIDSDLNGCSSPVTTISPILILIKTFLKNFPFCAFFFIHNIIISLEWRAKLEKANRTPNCPRMCFLFKHRKMEIIIIFPTYLTQDTWRLKVNGSSLALPGTNHFSPKVLQEL